MYSHYHVSINILMNQEIIRAIRDSITVKEKIAMDSELLSAIDLAVMKIIACFQHKGKVLFCGNGGSAADAQHLAAELSGRFYYDRPALQAEALHVNSSFVTAVANDYGYDHVFARMVEASGREGDVLVALSASGNSENMCRAIETAKNCGMHVIGLTGATGGKMGALCNITLKMPSTDTPRIQEAHILIGHVICEQVEKKIFPRL